MAISKRRLTAAEFEAVRLLLPHISQDRIDAARAALVDGLSQQAIATPYGWTRQAVNDTVTVVWKVVQDYRLAQSKSANAGILLPPGWEQVTLIAPTALIEKFKLKSGPMLARRRQRKIQSRGNRRGCRRARVDEATGQPGRQPYHQGR